MFRKMLTVLTVAGHFGMVSTGSLPLEPGQLVESILSAAMLRDARQGRRQ